MIKKNSRNVKEENSLHKSLRYIIVLAQLFGFFPVQGVLGKNIKYLKFCWRSATVWLTVPTWIGGWFCALSHIKSMLTKGYDSYEMNGVVFNFSNGTYCLLFIFLAKDWPHLMKEWHKLDKSLEKYGWPKTLDLRLTITSVIFLTLEAGEHLTVQINKAIVAYQCKGSLERSAEYFFANMTFGHIFNMVDYTPWRGIILQLINTRLAFCWTYVDLFIILMCCCIAARFEQISKKLKQMKINQVTDVKQWRDIREDYNNIRNICLLTDEKLSYLVVLSFITNFYFIIFHLFRSLNVRESPLETAYFYISFGLLILRAVCVCWYGGWVHEETKAPLTFLGSILPTSYNVETERFINTVRFESTGITGMHFFKVTKGLILKIANAIVTYELVVIQFNGNSVQKKVSLYSLCE